MKIMVAGSTPIGDKAYEDLCNSLASILLKNKCEIILGSDRATTADRIIVDHLIKQNKEINIKMYYHESKAKPFDNNSKLKNNNVNITYVQLKEKDWGVGRIQQIYYSDVVIIIGGSEKTEHIISICNYLNKVVIPIPAGEKTASSDYWKTFINKYSHDNLELIENFNEKSNKTLINFINKYAYRNMYDSITNKQLFLFALPVIFSIFMWILLLNQFIPINEKISLFVLAILASFFSISINSITFIKENRYLDLKEFLVVKPLYSLISCILLIVIYVVTTLSINGDVSIFDKLNEGHNFIRIGFTFTILGIIAGVKQDSVMKMINTNLESFDFDKK